MEEKKEGVNPFEVRSQEKNLVKLKQQKRQEKNMEIKTGKKVKKTDNNVENNNSDGKFLGKKFARKQVNERLKSENKALTNTLEIAQKSSGSMGKFDKKLKNEKPINTLKKNKIKHDILTSRKSEKNRDKSIMENILRANNK
jgi:hypothetical protein